jgi:hypothetical protein
MIIMGKVHTATEQNDETTNGKQVSGTRLRN